MRQKINKLRRLQREADGLRRELGISPPGEVTYQADLDVTSDDIRVLRLKDKTIDVYPPGQLLLIDTYTRDRKSGKKRYVFHLEIPACEETMTWSRFRQSARSHLRLDKDTPPRTMPVPDVESADRLLSLWTPRGRISRR